MRTLGLRSVNDDTMMSYSPVKQVPGEIRGTLQRADYMLSIAEKALKDVALTDTDQPGFRRYIKRVPLGVVLVIAPWKCVRREGVGVVGLTTGSYPYLTMINSVLPALVAGARRPKECGTSIG